MGRALGRSVHHSIYMSIQSEIAASESEKNRPHCHLSCQEAIEPALRAVAEMADDRNGARAKSPLPCRSG